MGAHNQFTQHKIELDIFNVEYIVSFTRVTRFVYDSNYGADADGHRGIPTTFIDEDYAVDIGVNDRDLTFYPLEVQAEVVIEIDHWMETHEPKEEG